MTKLKQVRSIAAIAFIVFPGVAPGVAAVIICAGNAQAASIRGAAPLPEFASPNSYFDKAPKVEDGSRTLQQMTDKARQMRSYVFDSVLTIYKDGRPQVETGRFYFKAPNMVRFEAKSAGSRSGAVVVRQPDGKIRGKMGGLLSGIKVTLAPDSKLLKTSHGFNVIESDLLSLLMLTSDKAKGKTARTGPAPINPASSKADPQTIQILEITEPGGNITDRIQVGAEKIPTQWALFAGKNVLSITEFVNLQATDLADDIFNLSADVGEKALQPTDETGTTDLPSLLSSTGGKSSMTIDALREIDRLLVSLRNRTTSLKTAGLTGPASDAPGKSSWPPGSRERIVSEGTGMEILLASLRPVSTALETNKSADPESAHDPEQWSRAIDSMKESVSYLLSSIAQEEPDKNSIDNAIQNVVDQLDNLQTIKDRALNSLSS